jgi:hypothetical protein
VLGYTIAAEIGALERFASPAKLVGYSGLCPRVYQSGDSDRRGRLTKHGPRYLRWTLMEAATNPAKHALDRERYQATWRRLGKQRGPNVARVELARTLTGRSGTCSPAMSPSLRQAPPPPWPHRHHLTFTLPHRDGGEAHAWAPCCCRFSAIRW